MEGITSSMKAILERDSPETVSFNKRELAASTMIRYSILDLFQGGEIPPVRTGFLRLGNICAYTRDPVAFIRSATAKYGEVYSVFMLSNTTIWLRGPMLNKVFLEMSEDVWSFAQGMGLFLKKIVQPGYFDHMSTFVTSLNRAMSNIERRDHYASVAQSECFKAIEQWTSREGPMELFEEVSILVHRIMVRCLMGSDFYDHHVDELYQLFRTMEANLGGILNFVLPDSIPHPSARKLAKSRARMEKIFKQRLAARKEKTQKWAESLDYINHTTKDPSTANLKSFYASHQTMMMFAAHTNTVASIAWTILELVESPRRLQHLREDIRIDSDPVNSVYMQALIKETNRQYSGMSDIRYARQVKSIKMPGSETPVKIPAGKTISISPYMTHHDPAIWTFPDMFYPERWIEEPDLATKVNNDLPLSYIPFGGGSHRCPAEDMAGTIAALVVGQISTSCELQLTEGPCKRDSSRLDFSKIGSAWLKGGVRMRAAERSV